MMEVYSEPYSLITSLPKTPEVTFLVLTESKKLNRTLSISIG